MKKWILYLLIGGLVLSLFAPFTIKVQATSPQDDYLRLADSVRLYRENYFGLSCDPLDVTTSWASEALNPSVMYYGYSNFLGGSEPTSSDANRAAVQASLQEAFANAELDGSWGVSGVAQLDTGDASGYDEGIYIFWNENEKMSITFSDPSQAVTAGNTDNVIWLTYNNGNGGGSQSCDVQINYFKNADVVVSTEVSNQPNDNPKLLFAYNANVTYPSGYEGLPIPDVVKTQYYPKFDWTVNRYDVLVDRILDIPGGLNRIDVKLYQSNDDWDQLDLVDSETALLSGSTARVVNAPGDGKYLLDVYIYPPDGSPLLDEYVFNHTVVQLTLDGSNQYGTADQETCESGVCESPDYYEDCSIYGGEAPFGIGGGSFPDIIGGLACNLGNFGQFIVQSFKSLFVWFWDLLFGEETGIFTDLTDFETDTYGLTSIVSTPIALLQNIADDEYECEPFVLPLPSTIGGNLTFPCMSTVYSQFAGIFAIYQIIISGILSYWILVDLLAILKGVKDPQNDRIEVMKL